MYTDARYISIPFMHFQVYFYTIYAFFAEPWQVAIAVFLKRCRSNLIFFPSIFNILCTSIYTHENINWNYDEGKGRTKMLAMQVAVTRVFQIIVKFFVSHDFVEWAWAIQSEYETLINHSASKPRIQFEWKTTLGSFNNYVDRILPSFKLK